MPSKGRGKPCGKGKDQILFGQPLLRPQAFSCYDSKIVNKVCSQENDARSRTEKIKRNNQLLPKHV